MSIERSVLSIDKSKEKIKHIPDEVKIKEKEKSPKPSRLPEELFKTYNREFLTSWVTSTPKTSDSKRRHHRENAEIKLASSVKQSKTKLAISQVSSKEALVKNSLTSHRESPLRFAPPLERG